MSDDVSKGHVFCNPVLKSVYNHISEVRVLGTDTWSVSNSLSLPLPSSSSYQQELPKFNTD